MKKLAAALSLVACALVLVACSSAEPDPASGNLGPGAAGSSGGPDVDQAAPITGGELFNGQS